MPAKADPPKPPYRYADFFLSGSIWAMWLVLLLGAALIENDGDAKWVGLILVILACIMIPTRAIKNRQQH